MLRIDEGQLLRLLLELKPRRAVLSAPDGLLRQLGEVAARLSKQVGTQLIVWAEPSYGACDTLDYVADLLGAEVAINIGHTISLPRLGRKTYFVDAYDDVDFTACLRAALPLLGRYSKVALVTTSQHLPALEAAARFLLEHGITPLIGKGRGQLRAGQVFGCEFHPLQMVSEEAEAVCFLGQSRFHAIGVALATGKPTYMLDPYEGGVVEVSEEARRFYKKAVLAVLKARDCRRFGVIIGLREGQLDMKAALFAKDELEKRGRTALLIALHDVEEGRLAAFQELEAFIETACPRIAIDDHFSRPVLSMPQARALFSLWDGRDPEAVFESFLRLSHWL